MRRATVLGQGGTSPEGPAESVPQLEAIGQRARRTWRAFSLIIAHLGTGLPAWALCTWLLAAERAPLTFRCTLAVVVCRAQPERAIGVRLGAGGFQLEANAWPEFAAGLRLEAVGNQATSPRVLGPSTRPGRAEVQSDFPAMRWCSSSINTLPHCT